MYYFGTDGIRGKSTDIENSNIAEILGYVISQNCKKVIVGRDVRDSSSNLEKQLCRGLLRGDIDIYVTGVLPTPALSYIAKLLDVDFAIMITASHNTPEYNGFKVFGKGGKQLNLVEEEAIDQKLACAIEEHLTRQKSLPISAKTALKPFLPHEIIPDFSVSSEIAADNDTDLQAFQSNFLPSLAQNIAKSKIHVFEGASFCYKKHILASFPRFDGVKVHLDCAYGCFAEFAEDIFSSLGAIVTAENNIRDSNKINVGCGSTCINSFLPLVKKDEIGFAFDGDGDRVIAVVDGKIYDGDAMLLALSTIYRLRGKLNNRFLVGTILSNSRLERELAKFCTAFLRADVGDKFIADTLKKHNCTLGGEKNGHILMLDKSETCDGLITALSLLEARKIIGTLPKFSPFPMREFNVCALDPKTTADGDDFKVKTETAKKIVGSKGRIVIRPSGTEPCIRVAVEYFSKNHGDVFSAIQQLFCG